MQIFTNTYKLITSNGKAKFFKLVLKLQFLSMFEALGIASIMPVLSYLADPQSLSLNSYNFVPQKLIHEISTWTDAETLLILSFISFTTLVFSAIYRSHATHSINIYLEALRETIASNIYSNLIKQPLSYHEKHNSNELLKSITSETDFLIGSSFRPILTMLASISTIFLILLIIFFNDVYVATGTIGFLGGLYVVVFVLTKSKISTMGEQLVEANSARFVNAKDGLASITSIQLTNTHQIFEKNFKRSAHQFGQLEALFQTLHTIPKFIIESIAIGSMLITLSIIVMVNEHTIDGFLQNYFPLIGLYAISAYKLQPALQALYQGFSSYKYGGQIVKQSALLLDLSNAEPTRGPEIENLDEIAILNVDLRVTTNGPSVLKDVSMVIKHGSTVGIFGESGSGKSTLIKFILGMITPSRGNVEVSGQKLNSFRHQPWFNIVGYVPQEVFLLDKSILENVAFGVPPNSIDIAQVKRCCSLAQIDQHIEDLPERYQTSVGDAGSRLSGGQRQRIGIARALYRNPSVLVFDEATSALDESTERNILEVIYNLADFKTVIMVSHKLETLAKCNLLYEVRNASVTKVQSTRDDQ